MLGFVALFDVLNKNNVQYLVAGGVAVNLYGIERATSDIDLVVYLESENLGRFIDVMKGLALNLKFRFGLKNLLMQKKENYGFRKKELRSSASLIPKILFCFWTFLLSHPLISPKHMQHGKKSGQEGFQYPWSQSSILLT